MNKTAAQELLRIAKVLLSSEHPIVEESRQAALKGIAEDPKRNEHGHTGKQGFVSHSGGKISVYNDYPEWQGKGGIVLHSHGGSNWQTYTGTEPEQTFSGDDVRIFVKQLLSGDSKAWAVIHPTHGTLDILHADGTPADKLAALSKLKPKDFKKLQVGYDEAVKWLESNPGKHSYEADREKLREFAKHFGLKYEEKVPFRPKHH